MSGISQPSSPPPSTMGVLERIAPRAAWYIPGRPVLSLRRLASLLYFWMKRKAGRDYSFNPPGESSVSIDVFMPALEKDADMLDLSLASVRQYVWHPIGAMYVIGPQKSQRLRAVAKKHSAIFIEEETVLPIDKAAIDYVAEGINRNGWIYKMLVNLASDTISKSRYILILDADTCFIAPQIFLYRGRPLFNVSNEYHQAYFTANKRLLGLRHKPSRSFITHYMLFDAHILQQLRHDIENRWNKPWYQAIIDIIDKSQVSGFADYEVYGDYYLTKGRPRPIVNYWSNVSLTVDSFDQVDEIITTAQPYFRSVSLHSYPKAKK
jgi:hypothetical protein